MYHILLVIVLKINLSKLFVFDVFYLSLMSFIHYIIKVLISKWATFHDLLNLTPAVCQPNASTINTHKVLLNVDKGLVDYI